MSDTNILDRLFNQAARVAIKPHYGRKKVVLEESQTQDSKIEIRNIPDDAVVIELDKAFFNKNLFAGSQGECKRADYLIFSEEEQKILFIEMKRTGAKLKDIVNQLKGSLCVFEYTQSIAAHFFHENNFLAAYEQRFVSINHTSMANRKTAIERMVGVHNKPDAPLKISWAKTVQYRMIAA